ncbi:terpene cyclase/mutase family protein [Streptomyces sp. J2-1]|uniref:prenyltransferase/squalene oxidase repeat-containing protein n=1 Tax=Streptomyces corallincola TaxID=2851888 RepID=UPI001C381D8B|nr:prenyltransferase/squalene oxidase repeat-containing protein [Streptomyces corallincola]MBV2353736.1 terpene cyclase/mutase family protein [Streptomyces corallincola]
MNIRRKATALAAIGLLGAAAPATAATGSPAPRTPAALFGTADPTYDGVWRQSLSLLAEHTLGQRPAASAVTWLTGQQCADGGFAAYRADTARPCGGKSGAQPDTNSTAAAVQALATLGGHADAVRGGTAWLVKAQNKDGGWGFTPGSPSDTNSTSVVVGALVAAKQTPDTYRSPSGKLPQDLLAAMALPCGTKPAADAGALAYQPDKKGGLVANADASAAGVLGALGKGFVVAPAKGDGSGKAPACTGDPAHRTPAQTADGAAAYLATAVAPSGHLMSAMPGAEKQPDFGNTADTVVALVAAGHPAEAKKPYAWLEKNATAWAKQSGPAAYAQLVLAAHAVGADPRAFGGTDLVRSLDALGPKPAAQAPAAAEHQETKKSGPAVWWIVGVGAVAGIGIGFLLSGRRKRQQP